MSTTATPEARNISKVRWTDQYNRIVRFMSTSRCYGVVNAKGQVLSCKGEEFPSAWSTLGVAKEIAECADEIVARGGSWVTPHDWGA